MYCIRKALRLTDSHFLVTDINIYLRSSKNKNKNLRELSNLYLRKHSIAFSKLIEHLHDCHKT